MSLLNDLARWKQTGAITSAQHDVLAAIVRKDRFSVYAELTAILWLGVVSSVAGIGWTVQQHFAGIGDTAILSALTTAFVASLAYCFLRGASYSRQRQESPEFAFDYVLYFGCLIFGVELGFIEYRFHLLKDNWDHYLLLSSILYFALAYRFDNRFVLSLALSTLAAWFGLRLYRLPWFAGSLRPYALSYAATVALAGTGLHRAGIKKHFLEAYLHVAANVALAALTSGVFDRSISGPYIVALLLVAIGVVSAGLRFRRFAFVLYGVAYAYVGVTDVVERQITSPTVSLAYVAVSATVVIASLVVLARSFGRDA